MSFEHIKASVSLQENKEPSIYMALCMTESLFRDIEDRAGTYLSECEIGNDKMPIKLLWLCDQIQEIYEQNVNNIPWDKELERTLGKLAETSKALGGVRDIIDQISTKKEELIRLQEEGENAHNLFEEYKSLDEKCKVLEAENAEYSRVNAQDLQNMKLRYEALLGQKAELLTECDTFNDKYLNPLEKDISELEAGKNDHQSRRQELESRRDMLQQEVAELTVLCDRVQSEVADVEAKNKEIKAEVAELRQREESQKAEFERLSEAKDTLCLECDIFRMQTLEPLSEKIAALEQERNSKTQILKEKTQREEALRNELVAMVEVIDSINTTVCSLETEIPNKQGVLDRATKERNEKDELLQKLDREYSDVVKELGIMQDSIDELKNTKIPEFEKKLVDERARCRNYEEQATELEEKLVNQETETAAIEAKRNELQVSYDLLAERYQKADEDIKSLKARLDELGSETSETQVAQYRKQLEEETVKLEELLKEEEVLKKEILKLQDSFSTVGARFDELKKRESEYHQQEKDLKEKLSALKQYEAESFIKEFEVQRERLDRISKSCNELKKARDMLDSLLGRADRQNDSFRELNGQIQSLKTVVERICKSLVGLADSLKWEERS